MAIITHNNVFARLRDAAQGDLEAQRELVAKSLQLVGDSKEQIAFWAMSDCVMLARMAALQGNFSDVVTLIAMLDKMSAIATVHEELELAAYFGGEAFAWVNYLADRGDEEAATRIVELGEQPNPAVLLFAQAFDELMKLRDQDDEPA